MPRQRSGSASPKPTVSGRHGGSTKSNSRNSNRSVFSRGSDSRNVPVVQPKKVDTKPATVPSPSTTPEPAGRSTSDMMKDMAATAAGVAVGSAVGHAVGAGITGAFSGGGGGSQTADVAQQPAAERRPRSELVEEGPCAFEIKQFLKCSEENSDLNICHDFNEAMKRCRQRYNL
ncbi:coiled-coil-helix-coiled-coil-helix domain-containing protein 10, mitochondrial [Drosophila grimshawi]|uniref:GH14350 n=1 Tax=Drosophila grimshawi TaxID=7222 RepID=B4JYR4_DROGR|nr:coiled-coil-helix-coiled-coil-helix domain-containing protein 10, mitochondrial [Drosophila grimshawi]EDV90826.1 GH14350 [Drosophila grimshawi]